MSHPRNPDHGAPWWRFPIVWLVVGGPALVVVAAITTAVIAVRGADTVMSAPVAAQAQTPAEVAEVPAVQARNRGAGPARAN